MQNTSDSNAPATVSALVAAYSARYLESALRSVVAQTYTDLEVIVIDDSPGDEVQLIVSRFADPRIRYFRNPENLGPALSHQRAIELARGEFVAIINDDDLWEEDFVATMLDAIQEFPEAVLVFADHWVLSGNGRDAGESDRTSAAWGRSALEPGLHQPFRRLATVDRSVPLAIASLFRRDAVINSPIPGGVGGAYDLYLAYLLSRRGAGAVYVDRRLSSWRIHSNNQTGVRSCSRAEENALAMRYIADDPAFADLRPDVWRQYGESLWTVATRHLRYGSGRRAFDAIWTALRHRYSRVLLLLGPLVLPPALRRRVCRGL